MTHRLGSEGRNRLYGDLAKYWPLMSPPEEYADESPHWRNQILTRFDKRPVRALELGTGGGHFLSHLTDIVDATAVDLSESMLENARRLNPGVAHIVGDMRSIRLERTFDVVLIHDAIAYITSEEDLAATFATARAHLEPGGLFMTMPDHYIDRPVWPYINHRTHTQGRARTYIYRVFSAGHQQPVPAAIVVPVRHHGEWRTTHGTGSPHDRPVSR